MIGKNPTVLITDDASVNREVVKQCLNGCGYIFVEAENGTVSSSLEDDWSIRKALSLGSYDYFCQALPRETLRRLLPLKGQECHSEQMAV